MNVAKFSQCMGLCVTLNEYESTPLAQGHATYLLPQSDRLRCYTRIQTCDHIHKEN